MAIQLNERCGSYILAGLIASMASWYLTYYNAVLFFKHNGDEFDVLCDAAFKLSFVGLIFFYIFSWMVLLNNYYNDGKVVVIHKKLHVINYAA